MIDVKWDAEREEMRLIFGDLNTRDWTSILVTLDNAYKLRDLINRELKLIAEVDKEK